MTPTQLRDLTAKGLKDKKSREDWWAEKKRQEAAEELAALKQCAAPILKAFREDAKRAAGQGYDKAQVMVVPEEMYSGDIATNYQPAPSQLKDAAAYVFKTLTDEGFRVSLFTESNRWLADNNEWEWTHRLLMSASWGTSSP